ncbi:MAG: hypothetical protein ACOYMG_14540 [Candidatus Methylumidiphilus sp.]
MKYSKETYKALDVALMRILSGNPEHCEKGRKLSVRAVGLEAGLGNGSAYYYPEIVAKITAMKKQQRLNQGGTVPKTVNQRLKEEKNTKDKYRGQIIELRKQLSQMATVHHQFNSELISAYKAIKELKEKIAKDRRESIRLIKPPSTTLDNGDVV